MVKKINIFIVRFQKSATLDIKIIIFFVSNATNGDMGHKNNIFIAINAKIV
jgi:hypothetical protein